MSRHRTAIVTAGVAAGAVTAGMVGRTLMNARRRRGDPEALEPLSLLPPDDLGPVRSFDGTELAVRAAGKGSLPMILFVHGFSLDLTAWHYQWTELSARYRCVLFDMRSHGRSGRAAGGDLTPAAFGNDLGAVLDAVAPERPVLVVGHSMGSMAILALAESRPELFGTRIVGCAFSGAAASDLLRGAMGSITGLLRPRMGSLRQAASRVNSVRRHVLSGPRDVGHLVARVTQFGPHASPHVVEHVVGLAGRAPSEVWTDALAGLMEMDLRHAVQHIGVPSLVLVGEHDRVTPPSSAVALAGDLPDGRLEIIEEAGHMPMMEAHVEFNRRLERFAESVLGRSGDGGGARETDPASARVITRVPGFRVGHWSDPVGLTGCTVVLCPPGTVGSVDVKGGAPGTRETDAIRPGTLTPEVHAVLLTGGSAFGLAAADGVARWLERRGIGFDTGVAVVPIVPAAVLFDLAIGDPAARPDAAAGAAACDAATDGEVAEGSVGAGTGATVAKHPDPAAGWKGGVGGAAVEEDGVVVAALAAVNASGAITEDDGSPIAANRNPEGEPGTWPGGNTTLAVVATNATLSKDRAQLLAQAGSEGLSLAVRPSHTMWDGDTVFALGSGTVAAAQPVLERMAVRAVAEAIRRAVRLARPLGGVPAIGDGTG